MSFNQGVSTGDFRNVLERIKRRLVQSELTKDDKESLQGRVNNMRSQIDFIHLPNTTDNLASNPTGPHDYVFEPDITEVKLYNNFARVFGSGWIIDTTISSTDYNLLEIGDTTSYIVERGSYHYEPYKNFNGTTESVSQADAASLDLSQFSIACWFRVGPVPMTDTFALVNKGGFGSETAGQNLNYGMWINQFFDPFPDGILRGGFETSAGADNFVSSEHTVNDDKWHHAVLTNSGTQLKLYVDYASQTTLDTTATPDTSVNDLHIGRNSRAADSFYKGSIDEVYVWNNDLTDTEVLELWRDGTVPQQGNLVYSNTFGGTGVSTSNKKCYYAVLDGTNSWEWNVGHHPPSMKGGNSIGLNTSTQANQQFIYYTDFGTDFDFTANNLSFGFWIYPKVLPTTGNHIIMVRRIDANNTLRIEWDDADAKLFGQLKIGGTESNRQYDTALAINTWNYINGTCSFSGPTLSLKVNNNADTASVKGFVGAPTNANLHFGGYGGLSQERFFQGYLAMPMWYKHSTVLTTAERTSLYTFNTKSDTTKPAVYGYAKYG